MENQLDRVIFLENHFFLYSRIGFEYWKRIEIRFWEIGIFSFPIEMKMGMGLSWSNSSYGNHSFQFQFYSPTPPSQTYSKIKY